MIKNVHSFLVVILGLDQKFCLLTVIFIAALCLLMCVKQPQKKTWTKPAAKESNVGAAVLALQADCNYTLKEKQC